MSKVPFLTHNECRDLIKAVGHKRTVLVSGENGTGKTSIQYDLMRDPAYADYLVLPPFDCTLASDGSFLIPDVDRELGVSRELPNERFGVHRGNHKGKPGSRPVIVCLDEYAKAKPFIQAMLAPLALERRIGALYLPEGSIVWGTTNLTDEGLGDSMAAHTKSRLVMVNKRKATYEEWKTQWAAANGVHHVLLATLEEMPKVFDSFVDYLPGGAFHGRDQEKDNPFIFNPRVYQDAFASPRTLAAASDVLHANDAAPMTDNTLVAALAGAVGAPLAWEILTRHKLGKQLPPLAQVLADPKGCPLPDNPMVQVLQVFQFITQVRDRTQANACATYLNRMRAEMQSLFINTIKDSPDVLVRFASCKIVIDMLEENRKYF